MKRIRFEPNVPAEVRAIAQPIALKILQALHRYAATGRGRVKPLSGEFEGLLRLRVGTTACCLTRAMKSSPSTALENAKRPISK